MKVMNLSHNGLVLSIASLMAYSKQLIPRGELNQAEKNIQTAYDLISQYENSQRNLNFQTQEPILERLKKHVDKVEQILNETKQYWGLNWRFD